MKRLIKVAMATFIIGSLGVSASFADFATSFEPQEGYVDGQPLTNNGWTYMGSADDSHTIATSAPLLAAGPHSGDLCALVYGRWDVGYSAAVRQFDPYGGDGQSFTVKVTAWIAAQEVANAGSGMVYVMGGGNNLAYNAAAIFGINGGDKLCVYDGNQYVFVGTASAQTWYRFEATIHADGTGSGSYDVYIWGPDIDPITVTGLSFRANHYGKPINLIDRITLLSNKDLSGGRPETDSYIYFDDINVVPEPASLLILGLSSIFGLTSRRN